MRQSRLRAPTAQTDPALCHHEERSDAAIPAEHTHVGIPFLPATSSITQSGASMLDNPLRQQSIPRFNRSRMHRLAILHHADNVPGKEHGHRRIQVFFGQLP